MQMLIIGCTLCGLCISGPALAEIRCGDQPRVNLPADRAEGFKADASGKAQLLSRVLPQAEINGKVEQWSTEQRQRYQNIDQQEQRLYFMWVSCQIISSSTQMTDREKQLQWSHVLDAFSQLPASHEPTFTNEPGHIERFELDGGQTILLTQDQVTFTAIGPPFAANGNLMGVSVEGKVHPLSLGSNVTFPFSGGFCKVTCLLHKGATGGGFSPQVRPV